VSQTDGGNAKKSNHKIVFYTSSHKLTKFDAFWISGKQRLVYGSETAGLRSKREDKFCLRIKGVLYNWNIHCRSSDPFLAREIQVEFRTWVWPRIYNKGITIIFHLID
jgi:hypothetical protein